ncbi:hypothetical protein LOD99_8263 [Oopsacas minuta]|uniref:Uncharacterized protein n=1 Tax=Oopsacas minuta TaxID=111878 RepID=A0AAV7JGW6_9METZ|nr:hypothetical protein LOD99_8263 [Oopsacas minuta]
MITAFILICCFVSSAVAQTCNDPLLQSYSPVQSFVDRILANSLTTVIGPDSLPLLDRDSYFIGESPNNVTTIIELNAPTADLHGSFWLTGITLIQRPIDSIASAYSCASDPSVDIQLFLLQYSKNGIWYNLEYDNAPLGLYSFEGVTAAEEAEIRVAVVPTVVDSVKISKYYPGISRFCFQFELYGCEATTQLTHPDILQYNMLLPNARSGPLNQYAFSDHKYNGVCSKGICTGGVGLLTDGYIESSTYTDYSSFTGWDGSSTYSITLYLHSIYTINEVILYGSQWLALPVDSKSPDYVTVNGQRFKVRTTPAANEADFSYFGNGVYYISIPVVTTASLLDITFEGSSYYSLLLSEIELIADSGSSMGGNVQLREQIYYSNGSTVALEPSTIYSPENQTVNQSLLNQTFPTLPILSLTTNAFTNAQIENSTLFPKVQNIVISLSIATLLLFIAVVFLLILSIILCCMLMQQKHKPKGRRVISELATNSVMNNIHYNSNSTQSHFATNPQLEQVAYETITSFEDPYVQMKPPDSTNTNLPDSTRYSVVMKDYNHLKPQLSPPTSVKPDSNNFPVPSPLYKIK